MYCHPPFEGLSVNLKRIYVDILVTLGVDASRAQKEYQRVTGQRKSRRQTSMTESFCEDLTQKAKDGSPGPRSSGGKKELHEGHPDPEPAGPKNSPCLVGEPGVSARRPSWKDWPSGSSREEVPEMLKGKRVMDT